jgi:hypothetical protein
MIVKPLFIKKGSIKPFFLTKEVEGIYFYYLKEGKGKRKKKPPPAV